MRMRGRRARGPRGPSARPAGSERRYFFGIVDRRFAPCRVSRRGSRRRAACPRGRPVQRPACWLARRLNIAFSIVDPGRGSDRPRLHCTQRVSQALRGGRGEVRAPPAGHVLESCARVEISGTSRSEPACAVACVDTNAQTGYHIHCWVHTIRTHGVY